MAFPVVGFILQYLPLKENQYRVELFTREYGKISGFIHLKKTENIDIGMRIQAFIERKGKFNTIKNFQVLEVIPTYKESSSISSKNLIDILEIFALLRLLLPDGEIFPKVFLDLERVFGNFPQIGKSEFFLLLLRNLGYIGRQENLNQDGLEARISHILFDLGYSFSLSFDSSSEVLQASS